MKVQSSEATDQAGMDELVDRAVGGEPVAIELLIGRILPVVVRYCRSRMSVGAPSLATADDIAQEACLAILTALPTFRREGKPFLAFVYGIASHKVADAHRSAARTRSMPMAQVPDAASPEGGPEQFVVASSAAAVVEELLGHLPEGQQEILRLRVVAGLSAEETAGALGMTAGAVRVSQHRALTKLRQHLSTAPALAERLS
ncbi:MAG TPA: RNA polymerase sigma factor ShbA [Nakamurella sp.]|jgi:RNA polymerase sigma-70 factor (ECF subfamily)